MTAEVKPATPDFQKYVIKQGLEYAIAGGIVGLCVNGIAMRKLPTWRNKTPIMVRSALIVGFTAGPFVYGSMQASIKFERQQDIERERKLKGISSSETTEKVNPEIDLRTTIQRARDQFLKYKYQCIGAGWITGVAVSAMAIWRDKFMNSQQKVVQIRVYAQAITVVLIMFAVFATVSAENDDKLNHRNQHGGVKMYGNGTDDWQILAKDEENRERKAGIPISLHEQKEKQQQKEPDKSADDNKK